MKTALRKKPSFPGNSRPALSASHFLLSLSFSFLLAAALAGCSPAKTGKVVILGSNTVGEELAPQLIAQYEKDHPTVVFESEFKGTTYGFGALIVGRCDIAAASRDATTNEISMAQDRGVEFNNALIGSYAVAVVVNSANPVTSLTSAQVRDLFTGAIQNWKDVGGPDAPVHLLIRNPISGTYLGFRELAMENKPYSLAVKTFTNYTEIVQAVAQDQGGLGYASLQLSGKPGVKAVAIGGVAPTPAAVREGKYPFARALRLYTGKTSATPASRDFIAFVESPSGQKVLDQMGFVPAK